MTLRERKKARTRDGLAEAALQLFASQGFEHTTVDQIAEAADVSRRTFFRYFATKEAAVFPDRDRRLADFQALLSDHRPPEAPFEGVKRALLVLADDYTRNRDRVLLQMRIIKRSATVLAYDYELDRHWEQAIAVALGDRPRARAVARRQARMVAAALMGAIRAILQEWGTNDGRGSLRALGEEAFALLNQGVTNYPAGRPTARAARKS